MADQQQPNLSEYDSLCVDEFSRPMAGVTNPSPLGVQVELHRSWLQVRDKVAYRVDSGLPRPIVATIPEGEITYLDTVILAVRGPRDGVYFACWSDVAGGICGMVGLACTGRLDGVYRGVLADQVQHLAGLVALWGASGRIPDQLARVSLKGNVLRYCQGDLYIAENAGFPVPVTPVGAAELPLAYRPLPVPPQPPAPPPAEATQEEKKP